MNIYENVTHRILEQLKAGVVPWRRTWTTGLPKSLSSFREYRGINILLLALSGYSSRYWVTYREAQRLGGQVRKGERATSIYFWHWRTPDELARLREKLGQKELAPCTSFASAVFNLDQVDGIARPEDEQLDSTHALNRAESLLSIMPDKPVIVHSRVSGPSYNWARDEITLPHLSQFESAEEYYMTLYHEICHSTGSERRLNRRDQADGTAKEQYSFEELVAEFGASFLSAFTGVTRPESEALSASYIDGWAQVFQKDDRILTRAASAAQRAADYVRGKVVADVKASAEESPPPAAATSFAA